MILETVIAPPISLVVVMDRSVGVVPDSMQRIGIACTDSCVAIGTFCAADQTTMISLSDEVHPRCKDLKVVFCGELPTPSKTLSVCTVYDEPVLALDVHAFTVSVQVFADDLVEPSEIRIVVI